MDVSVIIVNYNTADLLAASIDSVLRQSGLSFEIIVIDNASQDRSRATIAAYGNRIKTILNAHNVGFGKANNMAFEQSDGRYIYLLNPDAVLQASDGLAKLVGYMDANTSVGIAGSRLIKNGEVREYMPKLHYPGEKYLSKPLEKLPGAFAWILGASLIIRREVYELAKGFDEGFFLYGEEADLCLRVRRLGYSIGYCADVMVEHVGGASERSSDVEVVQRKKQLALNNFYRKHYARDDVVRLLRKSRRRAAVQLLLIAIKKRLFGLDERQSSRLSTYKAIFDSASAFLLDDKAGDQAEERRSY